MVDKYKITLIISFAVLVFSIFPASAADVNIGNLTVAPGGTVTGSLNASDVINLSSATVNLTFDPSVAIVTAVSQGDGNALDAPTFNINNVEGLVQIIADNATGLSGDVIIAVITFQAVGNPGQTSELDVDIRELLDSSLEPITATQTNGSITITAARAMPVTAISTAGILVLIGMLTIIVIVRLRKR